MNTAEFTKALQGNLETKEIKTTNKDAQVIYETFLETIKEGLASDGKIRFTNFGDFEVRERAARKGVNPQSGESIDIAASKTPAFKSLKGLKDFVKAL